MEIVRKFENRVDIQTLGLELLGHRDADDFAGVNLVHRERRLVRAEHLGNFRVGEKFEVRAESSLNGAKLFRGLAEKSIAEGDDQFMRALIAPVHQRFDGGIGILLVQQQAVDVRNRDISLHVPEDFESRLNRDLRLGGEKRILSTPTSQRDRRIDNDLGIRRGGNVRIAGDIDRMHGPPQHILSYRSGLKQCEIAFASKVRRHPHEDFPIEALLIEADAAPLRDVLKNLVRDRIDRALRLARAGPPGDEPAAHEILHRPGNSAELQNNFRGIVRRQQSPNGERHAKTDDREGERRREQEISGQRAGHAEKTKEGIKDFHRRVSA
ncbi:MAG: hypothetical protein WBV90_08070 [Terrimicrobiaceae bacterium]